MGRVQEYFIREGLEGQEPWQPQGTQQVFGPFFPKSTIKATEPQGPCLCCTLLGGFDAPMARGGRVYQDLRQTTIPLKSSLQWEVSKPTTTIEIKAIPTVFTWLP